MLKLLRYLKKYWWAALLAPIFMVIEVAMDLSLTKHMAQMVDVTIPSGNINEILILGLTMIGTVLIGVLGGILSGVFANYASFKFANALRKDLFKKIMNLSYNQMDDFSTGSLVTRVTNDVTQIQNFIAMAIRMMIRSLSIFVLGIVFTLSINSRFGLILAIILPLEVLIMFLFMKLVFPIFKIIQKKLDKVNTVVHENVSGARVVKAFGREEYEISRFDLANNDYANTLLKVNKIAAILMPLLTLIIYCGQVAIYAIGGNSILDFFNAQKAGDMPIKIGEISASITYIVMVCSSLMSLGMIFTSIARASASASRLNEVLDCKLEIIDGNLNVKDLKETGTIEFKNVSFAYPGANVNVLENISFKINQGETIAIVGGTGCGKSTLVNLLPRFYDVTAGEVLVDGVNVKEYRQVDLRDKIAMVLQKSELFAGTMAENIRWGKEDATDDEVVKAAQIAQAAEFIESKTDKYDEYVEEKGTSLSGGQKQRLSIARAVIKRPEIMVFDDSTSALDLVTEAKLHQALKEELASTTKILVAQRIATAKQANKIMVLDEGKIIAFDSHDKLMETCELYQDIYNSQLKREGVFNE